MHWSNSSTCDYEPLDTKHHEILRGLLLVNGWVATDSQTPAIYVKTNNLSVLRWLDEAFGIFSNGIRQTHTAEEWYERDESGTRTKRVPETVERTPRTLRTRHIVGGRLDRPGKATRSRAVFSITSISAATETLEALMEPFEPRVYAASEMADEVHESLVLYDTAAFFDYIRAPPRPRFREKWPTLTKPCLGVGRRKTVEQPMNCPTALPTCSGPVDSSVQFWVNSGCGVVHVELVIGNDRPASHDGE